MRLRQCAPQSAHGTRGRAQAQTTPGQEPASPHERGVPYAARAARDCGILGEEFGGPLPGETVLILAAVYAGAGRLNIALVALLASESGA